MIPVRHVHKPGNGLKMMLLGSMRSRANCLTQDELLNEGSQQAEHRTSSSDRYISQTIETKTFSRTVLAATTKLSADDHTEEYDV